MKKYLYGAIHCEPEDFFDYDYFEESFEEEFYALSEVFSENDLNDIPKTMGIYLGKGKNMKEKDIPFPFKEYLTYLYYQHLDYICHIDTSKEIEKLCKELDDKYLR